MQALPQAEAILMQKELTPSEVDLLYGLRKLQAPAAVPALARLLSNGNVLVRREAASALRHAQSPEALRALGRALDDNDFDVRFNSSQSLAEALGQATFRADADQFRAEETQRVNDLKGRLTRLGIDVR
jgi:HEAT repeat protein